MNNKDILNIMFKKRGMYRRRLQNKEFYEGWIMYEKELMKVL